MEAAADVSMRSLRVSLRSFASKVSTALTNDGPRFLSFRPSNLAGTSFLPSPPLAQRDSTRWTALNVFIKKKMYKNRPLCTQAQNTHTHAHINQTCTALPLTLLVNQLIWMQSPSFHSNYTLAPEQSKSGKELFFFPLFFFHEKLLLLDYDRRSSSEKLNPRQFTWEMKPSNLNPRPIILAARAQRERNVSYHIVATRRSGPASRGGACSTV